MVPRRPNQHIRRDTEPSVKTPDHLDRQIAFAIEDLRHARPRADQWLEVLAGQTLLFHAELDRVYRIGRVHGMMLRLVCVDERSQNIESVSAGRPALGSP